MVGDRLENDMAPAKMLGFKTIRIVQGIARFQRPRNEYERPDISVRRIEDILDAVRRL